MAKIKLNGDTSGYIEISAPAVSGNNTLELGPGTKILTNLDNTFTGVSTFSGDVNITSGNLALASATPMVVASNGSGHLRLGAGGSEKVRITSAGSVGIGTDNPGANLTVWADDGVTDRDVFQVRSKTGAFNIQVSDSDAANPEWSLRTYANEPIVFKQATTERLRISSTGQIGMGKAGQVAPNGNSPLTIQESDSNSETICLRATNSGGNGSQPGVVMKTAGGGHIGGIYCDVNSDYMRLSTSGNDRVIITNTGEMGIGAFTPSAGSGILQISGGLRVAGSASASDTTSPYIYRTSGYDHLNFATSGVERLRISSTGNIGIGTNNPQYTLDLGESSSTIRLVSQNNGTAIRIGAGGGSDDVSLIRVDGNSNNGAQGETNDSNYGFSLKYMGSRTSNYNCLSVFSDNQTGTQVEAVSILQDGKVGINENSPTARLDINHPNTELGLVVRSRYGDINTAMVKFDGDPDSNGGDGNVVHIHGGSSRTDSEILNVNSTGEGTCFQIRGDGRTRVYKQLQLEHSSNVAKIMFNEYGANDIKAQIEMDQVSGSAGQLIFRTQNSGTLSERMRITNDGCVLKPTSPAFSASLSSGNINAANYNNVIIFNNQQFDNSNSYDTSNGRFTAPVAGKYYFGVQIYAGFDFSGVRVLHSKFVKNGSDFATADMFGGSSNHGGTMYHPTGCGHILMDLAVNDWVAFNSGGFSASGTGNALIYAQGGTRFFGYLVG